MDTFNIKNFIVVTPGQPRLPPHPPLPPGQKEEEEKKKEYDCGSVVSAASQGGLVADMTMESKIAFFYEIHPMFFDPV